MQKSFTLEKLYLNTLLNDQVLVSIFKDCFFHERYGWTNGNAHSYQIDHKHIEDLHFFVEEKSKDKQSFDENKQDDESSGVDSKMVRKILSIRPQCKVVYPKQALFVQTKDRFDQERIALGIAIVVDQDIQDDLQNDLVYMQVALQMLKQFHQNQTQPMEQFYALIFVVDVPFDHSKSNLVCTLGWIDDPLKNRDDDVDKTPVRMVISYLNKRNRNWNYIRLLELLWDQTKTTHQKIKTLQDEFSIQVTKEDIELLDRINLDHFESQ